MANAPTAPPTDVAREHKTRWWKEAIVILFFYFVYSATRNRFGSNKIADAQVLIFDTVCKVLPSTPEQAFNNAMKVIQLERAVGLFHEETIQEWFLPHRWFIQLLNTYYGTAHFVITIAVFIVLYLKRKDVFAFYRNALGATTALAIIGFFFFPLMPPRLLDAPCPPHGYGGACIEHEQRNFNSAESFGFVDTLEEYGGPWDFNSSAMATISNQYAAMPSLHIGWASWCAFAVWPLMKRRWLKAAVLLYPAFTLLCIIVTGNHFWIDGVGGQIVLGFGFLIGWAMHRTNQKWLDRKHSLVHTLRLPHGEPQHSHTDQLHSGQNE
jgi:hypothetical protein